MEDQSKITKVKLSIKDGVFEFQGSEQFVKACISDFKELFQVDTSATTAQKQPATKKQNNQANPEKSSKAKVSKKKSNKIVAERFDIHGNTEILSLADFIKEKKPSTANGEKIVVIGYYITEKLNEGFFTEGQVEYAYKMLDYKRPSHLHQIMINTKNQNDWFEQNTDGTGWVLTRGGDIYVSDEMPKDAE